MKKSVKRSLISLQSILLTCILLLAFFLRVYHVSIDPPGLYIDEVSSGYNGYTILTKGVDEHGKSYPLWFEAFGEYKMPALIYAMATSMAVFGKNEFALRFPSVLLGTLTVALFYFFSKTLVEKDQVLQKGMKQTLPLVATLLLAISSWHIQFSRGGFDATIALFFYLAALLFAVLFERKQKLTLLFVSAACFALTLYSYNAYRVITPVTIVALFGYFTFLHPRNWRVYGGAFAFFLFLCLPVFLFSLTGQGVTRFSQTSAFEEYHVTSLLGKVVMYPIIYLKNYLSYFSLQFLFTFGDGIGRHQIPGWGVLYHWQLPFLLLGLIALVTYRKSMLTPITLGLLGIAPLAAALTRPSPHTLRSLQEVIPLTLIIAVGLLWAVYSIKRWRVLFIGGVVVIAVFEFFLYLHFYYIHYPKVNALDWDGGYSKIVAKAEKYAKTYDAIVVDSNLSFAPIYFKFYDDSLPVTFVSQGWTKPAAWKNKRVLYIRPHYGTNDSHIIDRVYLPNINHDVFAEFWSI